MAGPIGIVAGAGDLPPVVARELVRAGQDVFVARLIADDTAPIGAFPGQDYPLGALGALFDGLKTAGCQEIVFLGNISRPDFTKLQVDTRGQAIMPGLLAAARQGDDAILQYLIGVFEAEGFAVLGGDQVYRQFLCPEGLLTATGITHDAMQSDLDKAVTIARLIGAHDIGQGAVVCRGLVLAVEGQEGTDAMLDRVGSLPARLRGSPENRSGVLVKCPKPGQDRRIDLPTIGPRTVERAAEAGLAGIGLEAGGAIVLDRDGVVAAADAIGLFITGLPPKRS